MKKRISFVRILAMILCVVLMAGMFTDTVYAAPKKGLNTKAKKLVIKETYQLKLNGAPANKVKWTSSDKKVAKVKKGLVTAKKAGTTVITAQYKGKRYKCKITVRDTVDLIIFAGQSNMMGHGDAAQAPKLIEGAAYEYKSVTQKNKLSVLKEPFGYGQDSGYLVNGDLCTGSMVTAFCNAYYKQTKMPVVGVAATVPGSGSVGWSTLFYKDVEKRIKAATKALKKMKIDVRHCYLVWMQGENDVCASTPAADYVERIGGMLERIAGETAVDKCMLIKTGKYVFNIGAGELADATEILNAQSQICKKYDSVVMISEKAPKLDESYYQGDLLHFTQKGLNIIGQDAGKNAGKIAGKYKKGQ